jgi:hypothetical protein
MGLESLPSAAVHESVHGTFQWRDVRLESAFGDKAEVAFQGRELLLTRNGHSVDSCGIGYITPAGRVAT